MSALSTISELKNAISASSSADLTKHTGAGDISKAWETVLEANNRNLADWAPATVSDWFTLRSVYSTTEANPYAIPLIKLNKVPRRIAAVGYLYLAYYKGVIATDYPSNIANATAILSASTLSATLSEESDYLKYVEPHHSDLKIEPPADMKKTCDDLTAALEKTVAPLSPNTKEGTESKAEYLKDMHLTVARLLLNTDSGPLYTELAALLKKITEETLDQNALQFFSYMLRLAVKSPDLLVAHYQKNSAVLLAWANLPATLFGQLNTAYLNVAGQVMTSVRPLLAHWLIAIHSSDEQAYDLVKKWFGSRVEFYGLSLLQLYAEIAKKYSLPEAVRSVLTKNVAATAFKVLITYGIYVKLDDTVSNILFGANDTEFKKYSATDRWAGRFARCYSTKLLTWTTFNNNPALTDAITGLLSGLDPRYTLPSDRTNNAIALASQAVGRNLLISKATEDTFTSDAMKTALRDVSKHDTKQAGFSAAPIPIPKQPLSITQGSPLSEAFFDDKDYQD